MQTLNKTFLGRNAFYVLRVTPRDTKQKIIAEAEVAELHGDPVSVQKAKTEITNPRTRVNSEVSWLLGVSPKRATELCRLLENSPLSIFDESGLPTLAHANLQASAFQLLSDLEDSAIISNLIQGFALSVESINLDEIARDINEERLVAGFPAISSGEALGECIQEQKKIYKLAVKEFLNRLDTTILIDSMTKLVEESTHDGYLHAEEFIDELVDSYEVETRGFLERELEAIKKYIIDIRNSKPISERTLAPLIVRLDTMVSTWDSVAQPIQLSFKARGITHDLSKDLGYDIRSLAIDLHNEHSLTESAQKVSQLIQQYFFEVPELEERIGEDISTLDELIEGKKKQEEEDAAFAKEITFSAEIGLVFKELLAISPRGISYGATKYSLDEITRVRWGAIKQSINGIPSGTTYEIAFGNSATETVVRPRMEHVYTKFTDALWRACGIRVMLQIFALLKDGSSYRCGSLLVFDDGVQLIKKSFFGAGEQRKFGWSDITVWSSNGSFCVAAKNDQKFSGVASYMSDANVHILEAAIRAFFKNTSARVLSDTFKK